MFNMLKNMKPILTEVIIALLSFLFLLISIHFVWFNRFWERNIIFPVACYIDLKKWFFIFLHLLPYQSWRTFYLRCELTDTLLFERPLTKPLLCVCIYLCLFIKYLFIFFGKSNTINFSRISFVCVVHWGTRHWRLSRTTWSILKHLIFVFFTISRPNVVSSIGTLLCFAVSLCPSRLQ